MSKYYKVEDVLAIFSEEERPLNWTDSESEIQAQNDFDCYKGMIESLPAIEVSNDCISREWLETNFQTVCENVRCNECPFDDDCRLIKFIVDAPSVVPTTEQSSEVGEWISQEQGAFYPVECSNCHKQPLFNEDEEYEYTKYCPYCGAKMKG